MPKVTPQSPPPPLVHPYLNQISTSGSYYRGRKFVPGKPGSNCFTQSTRSVATTSLPRNNLVPCPNWMQSQTFIQNSASQFQPIQQPVPASGTQRVTLDILIEFLDMMGRLKPNDDADIACAHFVQLKNLDPKAEIYFSEYGLSEEGEELLKRLNILRCAS
jgi:hypothetical protein